MHLRILQPNNLLMHAMECVGSCLGSPLALRAQLEAVSHRSDCSSLPTSMVSFRHTITTYTCV